MREDGRYDASEDAHGLPPCLGMPVWHSPVNPQACAAAKSRSNLAAATNSTPRTGTGIGDLPCGDKSVPNKKNDYRPYSRSDETGSLIGTIMANCLPDKCCQECTRNAKHGGQNKSGRVVRPRGEQARYDARDEPD